MSTKEKYEEAVEEVETYNKHMTEKYKTQHWDKFCAVYEWNEYLMLAAQREKLETRLERE